MIISKKKIKRDIYDYFISYIITDIYNELLFVIYLEFVSTRLCINNNVFY